ncbi:MAG: efflux RND transporter periplasmic adaptor subunit [Sulfurimonas sp.]|nr:efflux RND transporter periplasmic adaptor subunit [Sulfurimonas sp.]
MKLNIKYLIISLILALGIAVFYNKVYIPKTTYKTLTPQVGDLEVTIKGIGNVNALNIYSITAQSGGKILKILADDGDWVKKGDLLVVVDGVDLFEQLEIAKANIKKSSYDLKGAKAELKNLYAQKELLEITYKRYAKLREKGFASQSEYDKANADLKGINASIVVSKARINSTQAALVVTAKNRDALQAKIERLSVYSPVDGYVISKDAQVAQNVLPTTPILKIVDPKTLWIETKIDERISSQIKLNQKATITLRSQPKRVYKGFVKRVSSMSDAVTLEREVNIAFETIPKPFYINEQAEVKIIVKRVKNVVKIPSYLVVQRSGKLGVWLAKEGHAHFVKIEIVAQNEEEIAVFNINKESQLLVPESSKKPLSDGMKIH